MLKNVILILLVGAILSHSEECYSLSVFKSVGEPCIPRVLVNYNSTDEEISPSPSMKSGMPGLLMVLSPQEHAWKQEWQETHF